MLPRIVLTPGERRMLGTCWSTSGHERLVKAPCVSHGTKAAQGVGHHHGAGLEVAPGPGRDLLAANPTDTAQAHSHRPALAIELDRDGRTASCPARLARISPRGAAPPQYASSSCTQPPKGRVSSRSFNHLHQLVLDLPRGVVAHRQLPRQLQRRNCRSSSASSGTSPGTRCEAAASCWPGSCPRSAKPGAGSCGTDTAPGFDGASARYARIGGKQTRFGQRQRKQRLRALLLGPVVVHELHEAVALLKLNHSPGENREVTLQGKRGVLFRSPSGLRIDLRAPRVQSP